MGEASTFRLLYPGDQRTLLRLLAEDGREQTRYRIAGHDVSPMVLYCYTQVGFCMLTPTRQAGGACTIQMIRHVGDSCSWKSTGPKGQEH